METKDNGVLLQGEMDWLQLVIDQVIKTYLLQEGHEQNWLDIPLQALPEESPFSEILARWGLDIYERLALGLAMAPHLRPEALDIFFGRNQLYDRAFTEFGGAANKYHSGFLPTGQTLLFLTTSSATALRAKVTEMLGIGGKLIKEGVLTLGETEPELPRMNGVLGISRRWLDHFLTGEQPVFETGAGFPAQKIITSLNWEDVVLDAPALEQVDEINAWLEHGSRLLNDWGLAKQLKPGYRVLFYGPPGTGKTLTATLIGKASGREVYRVDLSMIVSKYIGETEKNLARVFDTAQHRDWILFFDEADALFGKRTAAATSNDRHANQQTAYLLQRIEDFPGIVILASNLRANMDDAFTRRFQTMVHFAMPTQVARYRLWTNAFSGVCKLDPKIDLHEIAENYELAGGAIINVLRYCALSAARRGDTVVTEQELLNGLKKEFKKENRTLSTAS